MTEFEKKIGYEFKDKNLISRALTHSSYANERKIGNNERLEFLGDSVLGLITAEYLFKSLKNQHEGSLTKLRASLVCEQSLFDISKKIELSKYILLGHGEEISGGRERPSVASDAFEAVLAAIYLDAGLEFARKWLLNLMSDAFEDALSGNRNRDYKTELQEYLQREKMGRVNYRVAAESGPDHDKRFEIEAVLDGKVIGKAIGGSKKDAEQSAAKMAIESL
ncbi:MAG: ribonuclease III [Clostridia bacterium]|nr:ribonuclease III [Clostridia bacterium]